MPIRSSTVSKLIRRGESYLTKRGVPNARRNSEWLLAHVLACRSVDLYLERDCVVNPLQTAAFGRLIERRGKREPLQYILGSTEFMSLPFYSRPAVFIPRPDTEVLVESVERLLAARDVRSGAKPPYHVSDLPGETTREVRLADLCCGSGVIAVAMVKRSPKIVATAVDVSRAAVDLTAKNASLHAVDDRVECVCGDAIEFLATSRQRFAAIVCNPPYIPMADLPVLAPEIRLHEPRLGLDGGADGLDFYRAAIPLLRDRLTTNGIVGFEIGSDQGAAVREMLDTASMCDIQVKQDYSGNDRVVVARLA
jgi:release factor glutamine methyltransferase